MVAPIIQAVLFYSKIIGTVGAAIGSIYSIFKYLKTSYSQRKTIRDTVTLLANNHLPHIQASLDSHGEVLKSLTADIRVVSEKVDGVETRLEDTKTGMRVLSESFLRHLENTSREV